MIQPTNQLRTTLEQHVAISDADWDYINTKLELFKAEKGETLTQSNSTECNLYFICSGISRLYYEKETRDITLNFGFPDNFISSYSSFLTQKGSEFVLQTLTPSVLIKISKVDLDEIYRETKCGQELGRLFAEQFFLYMSQRETDFMLKSPTERYLDLFDQQPRLIQEIPLKYLASYIGVTPQALSRIRAKIS